MSEPIIDFTPERMKKWNHYFDTTPGFRKMRDLIVSYAESRGGLTLDYWRLKVGPWFGVPRLTRSDRVAQELGVPVSELEKIYTDTWAWVRPRLEADPDYQEAMRALRKR